MGSVDKTLSVYKERSRNTQVESHLVTNGIDPLKAKLFASRGISHISDIRTTLDDILPIHSLSNVESAAKMLVECKLNGSRVCIVSDYDCDGATACAVLLESFSASGMNVGFLVPDREIHGYGLTESIVDDVANLVPRPEYIVTVDAGISSHAGIIKANSYGMKVIVTDHHLPGKTLPPAEIIVNPNQPDDTFQSKNIAGCGVAWYLATAYYIELCERDIEPGFEPEQLLPYVALGTVADVVTLDKNNRILVSEGMKLIRQGLCSPGIIMLASIGDKDFTLEDLTTQNIGFQIGPRINAAGRLKNMTSGILCLTTKDQSFSNILALDLVATNEERKEIQKTMHLEAERLSTPEFTDLNKKSVIVFCPEFHKGVVGIVAGKLKDANYLPAFVLTESNTGDLVGSGRSIPGFHLKHALDEVNASFPGLLQKFGGHAMAAGVTITKGCLNQFSEAFDSICQKYLTEELLVEKIEFDGEFDTANFTPNFIRDLNSEIWGQGFLAPLFVNTIKIDDRKIVGKDQNHMQLAGTMGDRKVRLIAFSMADRYDDLTPEVKIAHQPTVKKYNDFDQLQLQVAYFPDLKRLTSEDRIQNQLAEIQNSENLARIQSEKKAAHLLAQKAKNQRRKQKIDSQNLSLLEEFCEKSESNPTSRGLLSRVRIIREATTGESQDKFMERKSTPSIRRSSM